MVRVGFGGREGALASALICIYIYMYMSIRLYTEIREFQDLTVEIP